MAIIIVGDVTESGNASLHCHAIKSKMPKITESWLLFKYIDGQFTPLSKPFKTREEAEMERSKYPHRERGTIGVGVIRTKK